MADISPTVVMSASQRAKKVSVQDDEPLAAWITEVVETLGRPTGAVRVAEDHVTNVREQLADLSETGGEVYPQVLEPVIEILERDITSCRRLRPAAFSLFIEVLLATAESVVRARGLYILGKSLNAERLAATRKHLFQGRLALIGQGCLCRLYDRFTEKSVSYNSRRWMGTLMLELIAECEDNQQIIALMPTTKRAKLGSSILYEASEILRSITGRIVTTILGAEHPIKQFFPLGTAEKLFEKYPSPAQSASQWDKTFQEYVDEIWEDICEHNESNGELQFAQSIVTEPQHQDIQAVAALHCSIYIELGEAVRFYIHSGKNNFDSAIDVPFAAIEGMATALTAVDRAQQFRPVDVILTIAPAAPCFVNSLQASLSTLRLTVQDQEIADGVVNGISKKIAHYEEDKIEQQVAASSSLGTDSQGSTQSKISCTEDDLVLDGSYTVVNDSFVEVLVAPANAKTKSNDELDAEHTIQNEGKMATFQDKETETLSKQTGENVADSPIVITVTAGKKKTTSRKERAPALRNMVEVDIVRDMDTGEVLTSKVLTITAVPSENPEVREGTGAKAASITVESSDQLAGDGLSSSPDPPQEEPTPTEETLEPVKTPPPPQKKQPLKSKAPIRGLKTRKGSTAEDALRLKQDTAPPKEMTKSLHPPQDPAEASKKAKLDATTKKPTKVTAKVHALKRIDDSKDEDAIYNVSSSLPRAKNDTKAQMKGKKATIPGMSIRMPGGKRKGVDEGGEELDNVVDPKNPVSRAKKDSSNKKPLKKVTPEATATASRSKRASALRSTKGKKSMKDLSDSEIEELVVEEASIMERAHAVKDKKEGVAHQSTPAAQESNKQNQTTEVPKGVIHSQEEENAVKSVPHVQDGDDGKTRAPDVYGTVAKADQKPPVAPLVAKKNVIGQPITCQQSHDNESDDLQPQAEEQEISLPEEQDESQDVFRGATIAASIEESDDLDMALPPTADAQKPAATVEAKIGRKMADIFKFASANVVPDKKQKHKDIRSPQKPSPIAPKSSPPVEDKVKSPKVVVDSQVAGPHSVGSEEIQAVLDGDEFIVLSWPPKIIETEMEKDISKVAELSPAQEQIVVSDSDEEPPESPNRDKISAEKRSLAAPSAGDPSKRQRVATPMLVSSPLQPVVVRLSKRGAIKAKVQARKQAMPLSKSSPPSALRKGHVQSVDQSVLVDDHQARKTPMIAFGPNGPRNQGLSSGAKPARATKQVEPSILSGIFEKLSKRGAEEKLSPTDQAGKMSIGGLRPQSRVPRAPGSNDSIARFGSAESVSQSNQDDEGMAFFDAGQSVASSRSHSRVDVNGSPQPKRASLAPAGPLSRVAKDLSFVPAAAKAMHRPRKDMVHAEKNSNDGVAFDDDTTLFSSGFLSNRKVRPAPPGDDLDFESRYTPHHSAENGTYVGVTTQNVVDAAAHITDPFTIKVKRQDSDFARKLRTAVNQEAKTAAQSHVPPTAKAQTRVQPFMKLLPHPSRLRSLVEADTTLVDVENQPPRRSRRSRKEESSSESTDSEADALGQDEPATPTPQETWRAALKPHQQDVSDVLHHVVDGLLQQLFDKEPAIQAIADEYRDNGIKIVEGLKSKMGAEIQSLHANATSSIEHLAQSLRQSRTALKASLGGSKELDDQYKAWRARQHDLQSLPFMARPNSGR